MRVVIAELKQETNTFVPYPTTMAAVRGLASLGAGGDDPRNFRGNNCGSGRIYRGA